MLLPTLIFIVQLIFQPPCPTKSLVCDLLPQPQGNEGEIFTWSGPLFAINTHYLGSCSHAGTYGLRFIYGFNKDTEYGGWGIHWANTLPKHYDVSKFNNLTFWVKGTKGGETFQIGLKDSKNNDFRIESKSQIILKASTWSLVTVPLNNFKDVQLGFLDSLYFSFNRDHSYGDICIDDIAFQ